jgi:hypothetical protein
MSFHLNKPVCILRSDGMRSRASSTSLSVKILHLSAMYIKVWRYDTHQLALARAGSWGMAKAVQRAQGSETTPQMLRCQFDACAHGRPFELT